MSSRRLLALSAATIAVLALSACGASASGQTAVRVAGGGISRTRVVHFMAVLASRGAYTPGRPVFATPVPPRYLACISYLKAYGPKLADGGTPTPAELRANCALEYERLKLKSLYLLISYDWVAGEAAELGVTLSHAEVARQLALFKRLQPSDGGTFTAYLKATGQSVSDLLVSLKLGLFATRVQQRLEAKASAKHLTGAQRQQALEAFSRRFVARWRARTVCSSGYVVPICRNYKPPRKPSALVPPGVPLTNMTAE